MNSLNLKVMTDGQLLERVEYLVRRERELVECLIWHLQEIQERKLFIKMGFTSLFECLVKHFKYSEAVAYSRISALKIINAVPQAAEALNTGEVNLTTLSLTQSFIRKQEKETGEKVSLEQKIQYIESIKNKSTQETKQILATIRPVQELPVDKINYLSQTHAQMQITVEKTLLEKFEKLKALISHENIDPSYNELLHLTLDTAIDAIERKKGVNSVNKLGFSSRERISALEENAGEQSAKFAESNGQSEDGSNRKLQFPVQTHTSPEVRDGTTHSFAIKSSRYISREVKRLVLDRSKGQCEYVHSNGERCSSKFQLQFDHILAYSKNGGAELQNIQSLCRVHNAYKGSH